MRNSLPKKLLSSILAFNIALFTFLTFSGQSLATAGFLSAASVQLGDSRPSATGVTYTSAFTIGSTATIKCINVVFSTNADGTGGVPSGITTTGSTKGTLTGTGVTNANWALYSTGNNGTLQFENSTGESHTAADAITAVPAVTITNTSLGTFYAQITTYSTLTTHTCSGQVDQSNFIALATLAGVTTSVTVQPTLSLSVANYGSAVNGASVPSVTTTSTTIPFGSVAAGSTATGAQTLTVSTNAASGYNAYVRYTQQLTDTNSDTIPNTAGTNGSPAAFTANSFGYTTDGAGAAQFTSNTWAALTTTNAKIVTRSTPQSNDANHVEYQVQIGNTQAPGTYSTVVIYTAAPTF